MTFKVTRGPRGDIETRRKDDFYHLPNCIEFKPGQVRLSSNYQRAAGAKVAILSPCYFSEASPPPGCSPASVWGADEVQGHDTHILKSGFIDTGPHLALTLV